jgi:hypothetical protein
MNTETYETEPVETGMQESAELEGEEENQESETEVVETETLEEADSQPGNTEETIEEDSEAETDDTNSDQPAWFQKRINKLTSQRKNAQNENDVYKSENEALKARLERLENPVQKEEPELPREAFEDDKAWMDYAFDLRQKKQAAAQTQVQNEHSQRIQQSDQIRQEFARKYEAAKESLPSDYEEVMRSAPQTMAPKSITDEIQHSDYAAEISYYFVKNPQEMARIDGLPRRKFNAFFDNLESDIEENRNANGKKPTTQTPKPAAKPKQVLKNGAVNLSTLASKTSSEAHGNAYYAERNRRKNRN